MKKLLKILLSLLVVITIGCTKDSKEKYPVQSIAGEWKLIAYENFELNNTITQSLENSNGHDVIVSIYENEDFNSIQISTEYNHHSAYYSFQSDTSFTLSNIYIELVGGELFWSSTITDILTSTNHNFEIEDSELRIYYEDNLKSILLELQD